MPRRRRESRKAMADLNPDPNDRFDVSSWPPDEAQRTLQLLVQDLCFWEASPTHIKDIGLDSRSKGALWFLQSPDDSSNSLASSSRSSSRQSKQSREQRSSSSTSSSRQATAVEAPRWKTAVDPSSGKTYYYDPLTRATQWEKPAAVRAWEKQQRNERRRLGRIFFNEMETNMRQHWAAGRLTAQYTAAELAALAGGPPREPSNNLNEDGHGLPGLPSRQQRVRTISAMDEKLLAQVVVVVGDLPSLPDDKVDTKDVNLKNPNNANNDNNSHKSKPITPRSASSLEGRPPLPTPRSTATDTTGGGTTPSPDPKTTSQPGGELRRYEHWDSLELSPEQTQPTFDPQTMPIGSPDMLQGVRWLEDGGSGHGSSTPKSTVKIQPPVSAHKRRNTESTVFVNSTMTRPDIPGTIKCLCAVYRAHVVESIHAPGLSGSAVPVGSTVINPEIFRDDLHGMPPFQGETYHHKSANTASPTAAAATVTAHKIPTVEEVETFYEEFFRRSQMEHDTIIMSLIYVERLIKRTEGAIRPTPLNWRSMLFSCMILASKVWDDLSMWNIDFSNVSVASGLSSFTIQRINQLEVALLSTLRFDVRVPASEYAKYYFLIRTMLLRGGHVAFGDGADGGDAATNGAANGDATLNHTPNNNIVAAVSSMDANARRTKSVDWGTGPIFKDASSLEQLLSQKA